MFVSNSMFDDEAPEVNGQSQAAEAQTPASTAETPAMRRARMAKMKQDAIDRRKKKLGQQSMMKKADTKMTSNTNADATVEEEGEALVIHHEPEAKNTMSQSEKHLMNQGLSAVFDPTKDAPKSKSGRNRQSDRRETKLDFSDMRTFLTNAIPKGANKVQCYIVRNKKGLRNKVYPVYELYMEGQNKFFLASKKRSKNKTSNYLISMDMHSLEKESASYLGKTRSNFVGTEFTVFDKGISPDAIEEENASISLMTVRQELAYIQYESNFLGSRGPRKMTVVVPRLQSNNQRIVCRPMESKDSIGERWKSNVNTNDFIKLSNKPPTWNTQVGAYVLNFHGRVSVPSVKNFQLVTDEDEDTVVLQFGRTGKDRFTMDFQWPLSPLQAFGICISSFDYKLACE